MAKPTMKQMAAVLAVEYLERIISPNGVNVPAAKLESWDTTTLHETANEAIGATALMHNQFIRNGGGEHTVSFTFGVDRDRIVQNLPLDNVNYAQGTAKGNRRSVSIETCVNLPWTNWLPTLRNVAKLLAMLSYLGDKPEETIVQHWVWYGKNCPARLRANPAQWKALLADARMYLAILRAEFDGSPIPATPPVTEITLNDHKVSWGFLDLWRKYGVDILGFPLSDEYKEVVDIPDLGPTEVTFQDWENCVTEWRPGTDPRIGAGIRKYKYHK